MEGLYAVGAEFHALIADLGPLEIGLLTGLAGRVIVAAQKDTAGDHAGTLFTSWTFNGHF